MRCEKCVTVNAAHTVVQEDRTLYGGNPSRSWDTSDREHVHDSRWVLVFLRCSNGHTFKAIERSALRCEVEGCGYEVTVRAAIEKELAHRFPGRPPLPVIE